MKGNLNARMDLKSICNRPELELDERRQNVMPKAAYTLTKEQKMRVCEWIIGLKFPDGYATNLARRVDMTKLRMHDMKSHNCKRPSQGPSGMGPCEESCETELRSPPSMKPEPACAGVKRALCAPLLAAPRRRCAVCVSCACAPCLWAIPCGGGARATVFSFRC
ncbi:UNVERIFIED_CONTAM: hypothetical protein Slati_0171200 [Sesamum latifolium]|uniref:Uncharacterized protein n=1 Tax=Sesamum latifolium TaxID=2727402 RepID=A0AAW2YAB5_9LAMI